MKSAASRSANDVESSSSRRVACLLAMRTIVAAAAGEGKIVGINAGPLNDDENRPSRSLLHHNEALGKGIAEDQAEAGLRIGVGNRLPARGATESRCRSRRP